MIDSDITSVFPIVERDGTLNGTIQRIPGIITEAGRGDTTVQIWVCFSG